MTKAVGYCEELKRNIPLDEAHEAFFKLPEGKRKRFTFRCGDPKCRIELFPLIVATLYDREDAFRQKKKSPYFREHAAYPHITTCTWVTGDAIQRTHSEIKKRKNAQISSVIKHLGLIFRPKAKAKANRSINDVETNEGQPIEKNKKNGIDYENREMGDAPEKQRPPTSRFITQVAISFLSLTVSERKSTPLEIENISKDSFYNICMPIYTYHPFYQRQKIYRGKISVVELSHVFLLKFQSKISVNGTKDNRNTRCEIKLTKNWLEKNDRALMETLELIVEADSVAWCFFYTTSPPQETKSIARFEIEDCNMIAVIPEWDIPERPEMLET